MPFGLRNSAQTFQRFIDRVLHGLTFCYAYIDDILIASKTRREQATLPVLISGQTAILLFTIYKLLNLLSIF